MDLVRCEASCLFFLAASHNKGRDEQRKEKKRIEPPRERAEKKERIGILRVALETHGALGGLFLRSL
jgi:hypothetical protein